MSVEGTWDLRSKSSPRSLCVFRAAGYEANATTNPFDVASQDSQSAHSVVFGTERGSLHYRTYAPPTSGKSFSRSPPQQPLETPRHYMPVDLTNAMPGPIVSVVRAPGHPTVFLLLVDDNRGTSSSSPGAYAAHLATLRHGTFSILATQLPRMSCASFHPSCGFVYAAGRTVESIVPDGREQKTVFNHSSLPAPGARSGQDALQVTSNGKVAVVAVGNSFYAVPEDSQESAKLLSFAQSSQVHPVICLDVHDPSVGEGWSCMFLASGRECAVVDLQFQGGHVSCSPPRNGVTTMTSPILAAGTSWPWVAVLTSDGLISIRSPSCMAIPLRTVEVGTRPNDYFVLRTLREENWMVAISYSGGGKVMQFQPDTAQDMADRLMRLAIDAFGATGFPRSEVAEAVSASFTATSYVGPEPTASSRALLRQYLEAVLGLADFDSGAASGWPTEMAVTNTAKKEGRFGAFDEAGTSRRATSSTAPSASPAALVSGTALLCLVSTLMVPPNASLANRAAKACAAKLGVVFPGGSVSAAATSACEQVVDRLLKEASAAFSLLNMSSTLPISSSHRSNAVVHMDFVEAAVWLLRTCGRHERAIEVLYDRLQQPKTVEAGGKSQSGGYWSQIKYESYTATHLSELWGSGEDQGCRLVLQCQATRRLLESNPRLGLSVFTSMHPQNESQWKSMMARDDPLAHPSYPLQVVELLKSINPAVAYDSRENSFTLDYMDDSLDASEETSPLPLESGRALAVTYLESAIGISTGRPTTEDAFDSLPPDEATEERAVNLHDELSYLLLEGIIAERGDDDNDQDTELGKIYRGKLRRLLAWPFAKVRSERLLSSLPSSFLQEQALLLGRLGRHEDALRILYCDLQSLELALEYCDARYERQLSQQEQQKSKLGGPYSSARGTEDCAYLPLVKVALESDPDTDRGITAAIQVLALRRSSIDRAAALRLLPQNVPVSAVARPFLIPALVDSESQIRRLTVTAALLRAKYVSLKQQLTEAQIKSQASLHAIPQLRSLNLGDPLHSSKPFKARPAHSASSTFPEVMIVKHFFPRHLIIQAKVTNSAASVDGRTLGDVAFVVAESSEEAIQPTLQVPLKALPYRSTGSAWCVLSASPQRIDGMAILTCELRYTVMAIDATTGAPLSFTGGSGRIYVEELQDMEVQAAHFS